MIENILLLTAPLLRQYSRPPASRLDLEEGTIQGVNYEHATVSPVNISISVIESPQLQSNMQCQKTCLIVNGGFFEPDGSPTGLLIEGGRQRAPLSNRALMSGTFMVKNGLFQMIRSGDYIADPGISFAVQNGPMLVEPGPRFGIVRNDLNRQPRTIIALDRAGCAHLVVLKTPVSLFVSQYIVARVVRNISYALNLDGGPSSYIYYNDGKKQVSFGDPTIPAYFIKIALQ